MGKTDHIKFVCFFCIFLLGISCSTPVKIQPQVQPKDHSAGKMLDIVNKLPPNSSVQKLEDFTSVFLNEIGKMGRRDIGMFRESTIKLRKQPNIVKAFINYYKDLEYGRYSEKRLVLSVIGELQRKDTLDFFKGIIWATLPSTPSVPDGFSDRDYEIILKMKAVEGIGFIRNEDGTLNNQSNKELVSIMQNHASKSVKITAIDTYMWNHNDGIEASKSLYELLNSDLHKYIERPRYFSGANLKAFKKRVKEWENKWGQKK